MLVTTRDYAIGWLVLELGLRPQEIVGLDVGDVDLEAEICTVRWRGRERRLRFRGRVGDGLEAYSDERPDGPGAFFVSRKDGGRLTTRRVRQIMSKIYSSLNN